MPSMVQVDREKNYEGCAARLNHWLLGSSRATLHDPSEKGTLPSPPQSRHGCLSAERYHLLGNFKESRVLVRNVVEHKF